MKVINKYTKEVRLIWRNYSSRASIFLNGASIQILRDNSGKFFMYTIPSDYKPGIISINGITISETVFDYLEKKGFIGNPTFYIYEKIE